MPLTVLSDKAAFDYFIQAFFYSLPKQLDTGTFAPVRDKELNVLMVLTHKVVLYCELFQCLGACCCASDVANSGCVFLGIMWQVHVCRGRPLRLWF